jgi:hypothetical protein
MVLYGRLHWKVESFRSGSSWARFEKGLLEKVALLFSPPQASRYTNTVSLLSRNLLSVQLSSLFLAYRIFVPESGFPPTPTLRLPRLMPSKIFDPIFDSCELDKRRTPTPTNVH